ncbi:MAG TPA: glycosyltransferase family 39 protein [Candidatus Didemnitutus sp.]|nr:glycosyltransferase family 39 protein [Candidatus Didemnitutus sp.]
MLEWLDSHPNGYWAFAWSLFGLLIVASAGALFATLLNERGRQWGQRLLPRWVFVTLLFLTFFAFRWPAFFFNEEMNPDESQIIAGAITLQHDPVFWRAVDGTTHGPLDDYPLLLVRLFGLPVNYCTARVVGALMIFAAVFLLYRTLARYFADPLARIGCLPALAYLAFTTNWDFIHYSSEHMPVFLLAIGCYCIAADLSAPDARRTRSWRWFVAGVALGASPLAKLQSAPIAAALLATGTVMDLLLAGVPMRDRLRRLGALVAGAALIPVLQFAVLLFAGEVSEAWNSYIVQNLFYAGNRHLNRDEFIQGFWHYVSLDPAFAVLTKSVIALLAVASLGVLKFTRSAWRLLLLSAVFAGVAVFAVATPGRQYAHYLLLTVVPGTLLVATLGCAWWQLPSSRVANETRVLLLAAFLAAAIWPQVQTRLANPNPFLGKLTTETRHPFDAVTDEILRYARPGEALGHWGWMCRYYVYTGMRQATREAHIAFLISEGPLRDHHRERYLSDLQRNLPPVFIDAVGPGNFGYQNRELAHEVLPAVRKFVAEHYRLVADLENTRIYVRNDRTDQP